MDWKQPSTRLMARVAVAILSLALVGSAAWLAWPVVESGVVMEARVASSSRPAQRTPARSPLVSEESRQIGSSILPATISIPPGRYTLGSPSDERGRPNAEEVHEGGMLADYGVRTVDVSPGRRFAIADTEVTQHHWEKVMGSNPSYFQGFRGGGPDHPVESVNRYEALAYLNAITALENQARGDHTELTFCYDLRSCQGRLGGGCGGERFCEGDYRCEVADFVDGCTGYRLPTEEEWEIAARAGGASAFYTGGVTPGGENQAAALDPIAWYGENSEVDLGGAGCSPRPNAPNPQRRCGTHPVGLKRANDWSFHDMLGNVWEWTEDGTKDDGYTIRGCGWHNYARFCRAAQRDRASALVRHYDLGLRPAISVVD